MKKTKNIIKKGDTVKVIKTEVNYEKVYLGKTGTVFDSPREHKSLDYVHVHFKGMEDTCFSENCLKIVKKPKTKKAKKSFKFVISSTPFKSLKEAENQIKAWNNLGDLKDGCRVYKVIETYEPELKLVKVKE